MSAIASPTLTSPRSMTDAQLDQLSINCIRTLSMDAVQQAKSGHPGTPMALAPLVYTLWNRVMRFDPQDPIWPNRDRFVLSKGHICPGYYAALAIAGYFSEDILPTFRKLGSPRGGLELIVGIYPPTPAENIDAVCEAFEGLRTYWWDGRGKGYK